MEKVSTFRGFAGEVVASFITFDTTLSAIPVLIYYALLVLVVGLLIPQEYAMIGSLLMIFLSALPIARFAIPASRGKVDEGWFSENIKNGETVAFIIRYGAATLMWVIPVGIVMTLTGVSLFSVNTDDPMAAASLMQFGISGVVMVIVIVISIFAPTLAVLVCTATGSVKEVISIEPWRELITEHKADIAVFYSALFGGIMVFWLIYAIPMMLIIALATTAAPAAGATLAGFIMVLPVAMMPILLGRLAGVFVSGGKHLIDEDQGIPEVAPAPVQAAVNDAPTPATAVAVESYRPAPRSTAIATEGSGPPSYDHHVVPKLLEKVKNTEPYQINNAILMANNRFNMRGDDPLISAEVALLYCKAKQFADAREWVEISLPLCLTHQHDKLAAKLLADVLPERNNLKLAPEVWERLAEVMQQFKQYPLAGWCLFKGMSTAGTKPDEIQKRLIAMAEEMKTDQPKGALAILSLYLKLFKASESHEMVANEIEQLKQKLA